MKKLIFAVVIAQQIFSGAAAAGSGEPIGSLKTSRGEAFVDRGGERIPARPGLLIYEADTLRTGADGGLGILLRDDSILSLGPDSLFIIEEFRFRPAESAFGFFGRVVRGTAAYLSGLIGKLSPGSVRFETPDATIGIRGTRFAIQVQ